MLMLVKREYVFEEHIVGGAEYKELQNGLIVTMGPFVKSDFVVVLYMFGHVFMIMPRIRLRALLCSRRNIS